MAKNEGQLLDSELARQAGRDGTEQDVYNNVYYSVTCRFSFDPSNRSEGERDNSDNVQCSGNRIFYRNIFF